MPVAEFPGARNWGYDGVVPVRARSDSYGGPDGLQRLVDAAHAQGLARRASTSSTTTSGPRATYLDRVRAVLHRRYRTPWGARSTSTAPAATRCARYLIDNALLLDRRVPHRRAAARRGRTGSSTTSARCRSSPSSPTRSHELGRAARPAGAADRRERPERPAHRSRRAQPAGSASTPQWTDDFHHALHALLTGERHGYYQDFGGIADARRRLPRAGSSTHGRYSPLPRPPPRRARRRGCRPAVRRLRAEPRPGRQPRRSASG